jgi:hypothetical protein
MSEDVFMIASAFGDVAELGQGYVNRADGERILLPLPVELAMGEGVRFIVHLSDGTPAFAGAGRCVQVSDQGDGVDPTERFETLLDSLAFDERSQPVYEYIVAVRQAVYAEGGAAAEGGEEAAPGEAAEAEHLADAAEAVPDEVAPEASYEAEAEVAAEVEIAAEAEVAAEVEVAADAASAVDAEVEAQAVDEHFEPAAEEGTESAMSDDELASFVQRAESMSPAAAISGIPAAMPSERPVAVQSEPPVSYAAAPVPSEAVPEPQGPQHPADAGAFVIAPLPCGMLQRPTMATQWQPAEPRFPQPSQRSGLFRYAPGALPVPQLPPRPANAAAARVSRAPAPN